MIQIGKCNTLRVLRSSDYGFYLDGQDLGEILLPKKQIPEGLVVGNDVEVFIGYDSENRLVATTEKPFAQVGEIALLEVVAVERVGAFLNWGLSKDLFLPHGEQPAQLEVGDQVLVYIYIDNTGRISSTMRLSRHLKKVAAPQDFQPNQQVDLIMASQTDLGYKAVVNGTHWGVLYENEVFQELDYGQRLKGFIKQIRPDGKIDLRLGLAGHKAAQDDIGPQILALLEKNNGFLDITDKTNADKIYELFGVSKKKFKMALGGLYKKRAITVGDDGIRLTGGKKS